MCSLIGHTVSTCHRLDGNAYILWSSTDLVIGTDVQLDMFMTSSSSSEMEPVSIYNCLFPMETLLMQSSAFPTDKYDLHIRSICLNK